MSIPLSAVRRRVDRQGGELSIIDGTGFVVLHEDQHYLVTNWHIVTGRDRNTGLPLSSAALPERLVGWVSIDYRDSSVTWGWHAQGWDLYGPDGHARWFVHPALGHRVDVVALPIPPPETIFSGLERPTLYLPYSVDAPERRAALYPTADVSIVGYPEGLPHGWKLPVWTRGTVATEPVADFDGEPCFLVDARTREGQSGSPVIGYWIGPRLLADRVTYVGPESWELFGIYSGRTSPVSDLGRVWRRETIREVIEGKQLDDLVYE